MTVAQTFSLPSLPLSAERRRAGGEVAFDHDL
jgi:hypothetical protein